MNTPIESITLRELLEEKRQELNEIIALSADYKDILKVSRELDDLIALYQRCGP